MSRTRNAPERLQTYDEEFMSALKGWLETPVGQQAVYSLLGYDEDVRNRLLGHWVEGASLKCYLCGRPYSVCRADVEPEAEMLCRHCRSDCAGP